MPGNRIKVRVDSVRPETPHITIIRLACASGWPLPAFTPGSHIDLHLGNGMTRSYSLAGSPADRMQYVIGVLHDRNGRGGSRFIHETLAAGHVLEISQPRNNFPLEEKATRSVFIAGGIGITPMLPMIARMTEVGGNIQVLYACRSRGDAAFLGELSAIFPRARLHFDDESGGRLDLRHFMSTQPATAHFYCCGPGPMLKAFEETGRELGISNIHLERFIASAPALSPASRAFEVHLQRTGKCFTIEEGKTILETLIEAGLDVPRNCQAGICGSCETGVLSGTPEHLDSILSEQERAKSDRMMICVSRSLSARLMLDL